jgi:hypothetical protein
VDSPALSTPALIRALVTLRAVCVIQGRYADTKPKEAFGYEQATSFRCVPEENRFGCDVVCRRHAIRSPVDGRDYYRHLEKVTNRYAELTGSLRARPWQRAHQINCPTTTPTMCAAVPESKSTHRHCTSGFRLARSA